jgi:hypothetical protein
MKLVAVTWLDAVGADGWVSLKDLEKEVPVIHNSVGYVVTNNKSHITITMSYNEEKNNLGAWMVIPKQFVKKIKEIK